jgi:diguanylate cyclase (GGDEF)-like protein
MTEFTPEPGKRLPSLSVEGAFAGTDLPSEQEHPHQLARRALILCTVLALLGSLASIPEIIHGHMYGAPRYLLTSSVVVELSLLFLLLCFRRISPEPLAIAASIYFGIYLSAGCVVCIHDKYQTGYVLLFFLWFPPLLVFNRLVNKPKLAGILSKLLLVIPLAIVACAFPQLSVVLSGQSLFMLVNLALSHLMLGMMLEPLTRYRAAYALEKDRVVSMQAEAALIERIAFYDPLTALPNRASVQRQLKTLLHGFSAGAIALLIIDLDNFRILNDALGRAVGDLLLQQVAVRLLSVRRSHVTASHLGGDQFAMVLHSLPNDEERATLAASCMGEVVCAMFREPFKIEEHECLTSASVGVSICGTNFGDEDLFKRADLALIQAKASGRNCSQVFSPEMEEGVAARAMLARDLSQALANGAFSLVYQPQLDLSGQLIGAEALIRWRHVTRGWVSPAVFIPLAEEAGLMASIGRWVLDAAGSQLAIWSNHPELSRLTLSVNVSVRQLVDRRFVADLEDLLQRHNLATHRLKLEITESAVMEDVDESITRMHEMRRKGIRFALDDFGTGHSSLSYLKRLPMDQLKIDRSFVTDVLNSSTDACIAHTIILLAQSLGIEVLAEGVETEEQRDFLAKHGCSRYQGYLFSKPLTPSLFEEFVSRLKQTTDCSMGIPVCVD